MWLNVEILRSRSPLPPSLSHISKRENEARLGAGSNRYKFFTGAGPRADGFASRRIPPEKSIALVIEVENNVMNNGGTWRGVYSADGCSRIEG